VRVLAVANQKGGCGKTTTCINLAACLAHLKKRVLLIDLDPQGHSSCGLGIRSEMLPFTVYDLLRVGVEQAPPLTEVIQQLNPYFDVLPATTSLSCLEEDLAHCSDRERRLTQQIVSKLKIEQAYDYIILDCPPNLGVLTYNALETADEILIPIEPSFFSLHGLAKITETVQRFNKKRRAPLHLHALLTIFDSRTKFAKEVYEEVKSHFQEKLFRSIIHESVVLKEAASAGRSVVDYAPESQAFRDYFNLALEYLGREWDLLFPMEELGWGNFMRNKFGPRRAIGGVLFQCLNPDAKTVEIAGDFNNWVPEAMAKPVGSSGIWQKIIPIPHGEFRYKFIVDGEWQVDPGHPQVKENTYGTLDSYLKVV
jgi:chromosome partitioning protein